MRCLQKPYQLLCLVLFFLNFQANLSSSSSITKLCSQDEAAALIQFKSSFSIDKYTSYSWRCDEAGIKSYPRTDSWKEGTDCCSWDGVTCDDIKGHVIDLDLSCSWLYGTFPSNSTLFHLLHLQKLNLACNNFMSSKMSSKFGEFASLLYLNLSRSSFAGRVPSHVSHLSKLVSLDLSAGGDTTLDKHTLEGLVHNLTEVSQLFLDGINMSSVNPPVLMNLSSSLRSLSLKDCDLQGKFPKNIFHLPNLKMLNLGQNEKLNLNLPKLNQSSHLKILDLSDMSFSKELFDSIGNLVSLEQLDVSGATFSERELPNSIGNFISLKRLDLSYSLLSGSIPRSMGNLSQLNYLDLSFNSFSGHIPSSLTSLKQLRFLSIGKNLLEGSIPDEVNSFPNLIWIDLTSNSLSGTLPSRLYTISSLKYIYLSNNLFSGHIKEFQYSSLTEIKLQNNKLQGPIPSSISQLLNLAFLDLSSNYLSGIVEFGMFSKLQNLQYLDLSYNTLSLNSTGTGADFTLPNLEVLSLSSCLVSEFPDFIRNLEGLKMLNLSHNQIPVIDQGMFLRLQNLTSLDFSHNSQLSFSSFSSANYSLPNLKSLYLSFCNISGFPDFIRNLEGLEWLDLSHNQIPVIDQGMFSRLENLTSLDLSHNSQLSVSSFSSANYSLPNLRSIYLSFCNISGFPDFVRNLGGLESLDLSHNQIPVIDQGMFLRLENLTSLDLSHNSQLSFSSFSSAKYSLPNLSSLYLSFCNISAFPDFIRNLKGLERLDLSHNQIPVIDQGMFFRLESLRYLELSCNSQLSLITGDNVKNLLPNLWFLSFSSCSLSEFPNFLRTLEKLEFLDLYNNKIQGRLSEWESEGWPSLTTLYLSHNLLTGLDHYPWKNLEVLFLQSNLLEGPVLVPPPSIRVFLVSRNKLTGEIPSLICNLSSLEELDLSDNNLTGTIPTCLGSFSNNLQVLDLENNSFHGSIPDSFSKENKLESLNINGNGFDGQLPQSLVNCSRLALLNLGNNRLNDTFPVWLGTLLELQVLVLRSNNFHGPIGKAKTESPFPKLRIFDVSHNEFSGVLPTTYFKSFKSMMNLDNAEIGYMGDGGYFQDSVLVSMKGSEFKFEKILFLFTAIDLSCNQFKGKIPERVGELTCLKVLNFSHNSLSGSIPSSMGKLAAIESLDLSSNMLVGEIPKQLTNLKFLQVLNLSKNQLFGPIPLGNQFNSFPNDSYSDNLGLCGFPLSKRCSKNEAPAFQEAGDGSASGFEWKGVMMGYGCGLVFGLSAGYIMFTIGKPKWLIRIVERAGNKLKRYHWQQNKLVILFDGSRFGDFLCLPTAMCST